MTLPSIKNVRNLAGKRVLVRLDLNVPLGLNKRVEKDEDWRIRAAMETLWYLRAQGARCILISHLGRPEKKDPALSLKPVASYIEKEFKLPVTFVDDVVGVRAHKAVDQLKNSQVLMLQNVRFEPGEEENNHTFVKKLAQLGDLYVNDAFAVCHRAAASVVGVPHIIPAYAGFLLQKECENLMQVMKHPEHPLVVVVGGAKTETKLPLIEEFLDGADTILLGGGIANTAFHCKGYEVGEGGYDTCGVHLERVLKSKKIVLPVDVVVGGKKGENARAVPVSVKQKKLAGKNEYVQDVGPATIQLFNEYIKQAKTIVWNGALGVFEVPEYAYGTLSLARSIATHSKRNAFCVVGGGETVQVLQRTGMAHYVDHVSTGGGAMLEFLAGEKLPGIEALLHRHV